MKQSKLFGTKLIENIKVPRIPSIIMLNKYEGLKDYDYLKLIRHCSEVSNGKRLISLLSVDDEELNDMEEYLWQ